MRGDACEPRRARLEALCREIAEAIAANQVDALASLAATPVHVSRRDGAQSGRMLAAIVTRAST